MNDIKYIISLATKVSKKSGLALSTIGRKAIGNARIFNRLAEGGECLPSTYNTLKNWLLVELEK